MKSELLSATTNELTLDTDLKIWLDTDDLNCLEIAKKKYIHTYENGKRETFPEFMRRITGGNEQYEYLIFHGLFSPAGRILSNRGLQHLGIKITYNNCYVIAAPEDNIESIYDTKKYMARTFSYGGGVGIDISKLAPRGSKLRNSALESTGAVSFCPEFAMTSDTISQNGRRGALMLCISDKHPDLIEFITHKTDLNTTKTANMSVKFSDAFFEALKKDEDWEMSFYRPETDETITRKMKANEIMDILAKTAWDYAEPGILYWDTIQNYNLIGNDPDFHFSATNPCVIGSTRVLTDQGYVPIKHMAEKGGTWNIWNGYEWSEVEAAITGFRQPIRHIMFSNNCSIECTEYHKFVLKDGTRIEAKDLREGDELIAYKSFAYSGNDLEEDENKVPDISKPIDVEGVKVVWTRSAGTADVVYCVNEPKNHTVVFNGILTGNCGELPLPDFGSCLLGSMNLSKYFTKKFDLLDNNSEEWLKFDHDVQIAIRYLNEVLEEGIELQPLEQQKKAIQDYRPIGLGILGLADTFINMGYRYGDDDSIWFSDLIGYHMAYNAILASAEIAKEYVEEKGYEIGCFDKCKKELIVKNDFFVVNVTENPFITEEQKTYLTELVLKYGLRNSQLLSIAPTGTISTIRNLSGGIEPIFALQFTRTTKTIRNHDYTYLVEPKCVSNYKKKYPNKKELPDYFVTARDISYKDRLKMQATWQKHIDNSISGTVNLPESVTVEDVKNLYIEAHEMGLKGITIFRQNCKRAAILNETSKNKKDEKKEEPKTKDMEKVKSISADTSINNKPGSVTIMTRKDLGKRVEGACYYMNTACGHMYVTVNHDENLYPREVFVDPSKSGGCAANADCLGRYASACLRSGLSVSDVVDITKGVKCQACSKLKGKGVEIDGLSCGDIIARVIEMEEKRLSQLRKLSIDGDKQDVNILNEKESTQELSPILEKIFKTGGKMEFDGFVHRKVDIAIPYPFTNYSDIKVNRIDDTCDTCNCECEKESLSNGCLETEFEKLEVGDSQPWNYKEHSYDENLEHNICPECGSSLGRGEGCPKCINCGFSKC